MRCQMFALNLVGIAWKVCVLWSEFTILASENVRRPLNAPERIPNADTTFHSRSAERPGGFCCETGSLGRRVVQLVDRHRGSVGQGSI